MISSTNLKTAAFLLLLPLPALASSPLQGRTIVLDPGHGTLDFYGHMLNSGKFTHDRKSWEYQLTFNMAQKLGKKLEESGARVIYTRTPMDYWRQSESIVEDNKARAEIANELKADVFIALHCDWSPRAKTQGVTTYYETPQSRALGDAVHQSLISLLKAPNRALKKDTYTVLDVATMPAILVETGYLSNRAESKKLTSPAYQESVAGAIFSGLSRYFSNL